MIETTLNRVAKVCATISIAALVCCILLNSYEIFSRLMLGASNYWIQDATSFCMVWFVFLGMIDITWEKKDIYIELLLDAVSEGVSRIIKIAIHILTASFTTFVSYKITQYMQLNIGKKMTTAPIPQNANTIAMLICMIFMTMFAVYDLMRLLRNQERQSSSEEEL